MKKVFFLIAILSGLKTFSQQPSNHASNIGYEKIYMNGKEADIFNCFFEYNCLKQVVESPYKNAVIKKGLSPDVAAKEQAKILDYLFKRRPSLSYQLFRSLEYNQSDGVYHYLSEISKEQIAKEKLKYKDGMSSITAKETPIDTDKFDCNFQLECLSDTLQVVYDTEINRGEPLDSAAIKQAEVLTYIYHEKKEIFFDLYQSLRYYQTNKVFMKLSPEIQKFIMEQ